MKEFVDLGYELHRVFFVGSCCEEELHYLGDKFLEVM